jgi:hypothetical protein
MQFLSLFTGTQSGPPDPEHMQAMGKYMDESFASGVLVATGGCMNRSTGMKATRKDGKFSTVDGDIPGSSLMPVGGWAVLNVTSREHLAECLEEFMNMAGDGTCEAIQIMDMPINPKLT